MIFLLAWFSASPFSSDSAAGLGPAGTLGTTGIGPAGTDTAVGNGPGKGPEDGGGGATSLTGDFRMISGVASRIGIGVVDSLLFEESISVVVVLGILSSTILIGFDWK